jgi:hypothetical protein
MTLGKISKRNNEKTNSTITVYSTYLNLTTTAQRNLDGYIVDSMFYYFRYSDDKLFEVNGGTSK